ncbi:1-acyl-sn-glycerol-3-phosphate acyltransferase [subsurface metagenome]
MECGIVPWFYYVAKAILRMFFSLLTSYQVRGKENIPSQGPLLVVANHINLTDPPLIGISLDRKVMFMAKEELFRRRFLGYLMRGFGAFPVYRKQTDRQAIRQAKQILAKGLALAMFPEGKRSLSAQLQPALSGSALIARHSDAPILPVGITGTEKLRGVAWLLHRPQITVNIGQPFSLPPVNGKLTKEELVRLTNYTMERIAELLPQEYQGNYTKKEVSNHEN